MNEGIVYLIQPVELALTNRYKIGYSKQIDLLLCKKSHKKGTRFLHITKCINPQSLEKNILTHFNSKFKLVGGNKYFEGNEIEMCNDFINKINEHNIKNDIIIIEDDISKVKKCFLNYNDDVLFGGKKKLLKIMFNKNKIDDLQHFEAITIEQHSCEKEPYEITSHKINIPCLCTYITTLINNKIIENNKIYDLNDDKFISKLNKYKNKINIFNSNSISYIKDDIITYDNDELHIKLLSNSIANKHTYCTIDNIPNSDYFHIYFYSFLYEDIVIVQIENCFYDINYLRTYMHCSINN